VTAIFAGDETSTGDEGREGGASSAEGEADANPPRCSLPSVAAKSAAAAKAPGENDFTRHGADLRGEVEDRDGQGREKPESECGWNLQVMLL
jgi:hypothetical protein